MTREILGNQLPSVPATYMSQHHAATYAYKDTYTHKTQRAFAAASGLNSAQCDRRRTLGNLMMLGAVSTCSMLAAVMVIRLRNEGTALPEKFPGSCRKRKNDFTYYDIALGYWGAKRAEITVTVTGNSGDV